MIARVVALVLGLVGAGTFAQFPEFSQQYLQRLGGAVDALGEVVADFDASATAAGLDRDSALAEMEGSAFLDARRADMTATFARHARLRANLAKLEGQGPFMRAYHLPRFSDMQIARAAWNDFAPGVPLTLTGGLFALFGFLLGAGAGSLLVKLLTWPLRWRSTA